MRLDTHSIVAGHKFVGELKLEAEDFTSTPGLFGRFGISVRENVVALEALHFSHIFLRPVLEYGGVDFGTKEGVVTQLSARVRLVTSTPFFSGGVFFVNLDKPDGRQITSFQVLRTIPTTSEFVEVTTSVTPVTGVHNVFIRFEPKLFPFTSSAVVDVDWFKFK